jgi:hypothetical protein
VKRAHTLHIHSFPSAEPRCDIRLAKIDRVDKKEARYHRPFESVMEGGQLRHADDCRAKERPVRQDRADLDEPEMHRG